MYSLSINMLTLNLFLLQQLDKKLLPFKRKIYNVESAAQRLLKQK
jgi:hypothetical protein